jgi:hypothetical protein
MTHLELFLWMVVLGAIGFDYYQHRQRVKEEQKYIDEIYDRMFKPRVNIPIGRTTWNIQCACEGEFRNLCMIHGGNGEEAYRLLPTYEVKRPVVNDSYILGRQ